MRIRLLAALLALCCLFPALAWADPSEASAAERIMFYYQGASEEFQAAYPYNAIACKSASFDVLGGNGCSIFAGLHAYQWLYGRFESLEEQTEHAQKMVWLLRGNSPAVKGKGPSVAFSYACEQGAMKTLGLESRERSLVPFFDQKGGALYLHATWPHGGHFLIAVGYTRHEIDGKETFLLHVVDSGEGEIASQFTAYRFEDFAPAVPEEGWKAKEYWMPLQEGQNVSYGVRTGVWVTAPTT